MKARETPVCWRVAFIYDVPVRRFGRIKYPSIELCVEGVIQALTKGPELRMCLARSEKSIEATVTGVE